VPEIKKQNGLPAPFAPYVEPLARQLWKVGKLEAPHQGIIKKKI
jgi:hypothetical protein